MDVVARIDQARRRWNVLEHPFYQRWSAGQLSDQELGVYAGQYRHAVLALAQASRLAAAKAPAECAGGLERHAAEEAGHVALWDQFAHAATTSSQGARTEHAVTQQGAPVGTAEPLAGTEQCARAWVAGEETLEHLAVLYAIEAGQPAISKTKLEGLVEHYGYSEEGPATEYFRLHATLDVEHARQAAELIERLMGEGDADAQDRADRMVACAEDALRANWALLDSVEAQFVAG